MRQPRGHITIRSLMIATVAAAGPLTVLRAWGVSVIVIALSVWCLSVICAWWLVFRRHRHLAAFGFWLTAILINVLYTAFCIAPDYMLLPALHLGWLVIFLPMIASSSERLGPSCRDEKVRSRDALDRRFGFRFLSWR